MKWLDKETSLYKCQADNTGRPETFRNILLCEFGIPHKWFTQDDNGTANDLDTIIQIKRLDRNAEDYKTRKTELKATLQCFTPAALFESKKKGAVKEIRRTGLMQLDFDYESIKENNIEELKKWVFRLPFIGFCGLSCSGDGFYALALIAEPERLAEYAQQAFAVFNAFGLKADTSKGKKPENLRYVSYDENMLIREDVEPLRVVKFHALPATKKEKKVSYHKRSTTGSSALVRAELAKIQSATAGNRMITIQQVAYTLGGVGDESILAAVQSEIESNSQFDDQLREFLKCAEDCFAMGSTKPLKHVEL